MVEFVREVDAAGVTVVHVIGEVDLDNVDGLVTAVRPCLAGTERVEVDLSALEFIDSTGLGTLVLLTKEASLLGTELAITGVGARIFHLLEITGLARVLDLRQRHSNDGSS